MTTGIVMQIEFMISVALYALISGLVMVKVLVSPRFSGHIGWYTTSFVYHVLCGLVMTYLVIHRYGTADLSTYYYKGVEISNYLLGVSGYLSFDLPMFKAKHVPAYIFSVVLMILPHTVYGFSILVSTVAHIALMYLYDLFRRFSAYPGLLFMIMFFTPSYIMQSSFIGKETIMLPLLVLCLYEVDRSKNITWKLALGWCLMTLTRIYQGLFFLLPYTAIKAWQYRRNWPRVVFLGLLAVIPSIWYANKVLPFSKLGSISQLTQVLKMIYTEGSHMLKPYPFPFTWLQSFRPFPWDAHNKLAMLASLQQVTLLGVFMVLIMLNYQNIWYQIKRSRLCFVTAGYVVLSMAVFSFDFNIGDLSRHEIYYMLLLFALLCVGPGHKQTASSHKGQYLYSGGGVKGGSLSV